MHYNVATLFRIINIDWQTPETALSRVDPLKQRHIQYFSPKASGAAWQAHTHRAKAFCL